ncbi:hypothetical protein BC938DRAFT_482621 [Jimgerdemannia flammicorona]|uniref:Protein kinase domain-containing protein n=1 Tax=Jimgerdemannia flammicorona TaxID=994334 RepID=A0A433QDP0_9FUNG|nr:hypothetical protein BC938DRAFT_482621 [Jimgerdemannia flammicorona]
MTNERLQRLLAKLKPFDELHDEHITEMKNWKAAFPNDETLLTHLEKLSVPELVDRLVWIPPSHYTDLEPLGQGGFATVYKAKLVAKNIEVAMKELDPLRISEVCIDLGYPAIRAIFFFSDNCLYPKIHLQTMFILQLVMAVICDNVYATLSVHGLTQIQDTGKYLIVMELAEKGTLEQFSGYDNWWQVAEMADSLSGCLAQFHALGFRHGDLHPEKTRSFIAARQKRYNQASESGDFNSAHTIITWPSTTRQSTNVPIISTTSMTRQPNNALKISTFPTFPISTTITDSPISTLISITFDTPYSVSSTSQPCRKFSLHQSQYHTPESLQEITREVSRTMTLDGQAADLKPGGMGDRPIKDLIGRSWQKLAPFGISARRIFGQIFCCPQ